MPFPKLFWRGTQLEGNISLGHYVASLSMTTLSRGKFTYALIRIELCPWLLLGILIGKMQKKSIVYTHQSPTTPLNTIKLDTEIYINIGSYSAALVAMPLIPTYFCRQLLILNVVVFSTYAYDRCLSFVWPFFPQKNLSFYLWSVTVFFLKKMSFLVEFGNHAWTSIIYCQ